MTVINLATMPGYATMIVHLYCSVSVNDYQAFVVMNADHEILKVDPAHPTHLCGIINRLVPSQV